MARAALWSRAVWLLGGHWPCGAGAGRRCVAMHTAHIEYTLTNVCAEACWMDAMYLDTLTLEIKT